MARLPTPGGDDGGWGDILNEYLSQSHTINGALKSGVVGESQIQDGAVTAAKLESASFGNSVAGLVSSSSNVQDAVDARVAAQTDGLLDQATADARYGSPSFADPKQAAACLTALGDALWSSVPILSLGDSFTSSDSIWSWPNQVAQLLSMHNSPWDHPWKTFYSPAANMTPAGDYHAYSADLNTGQFPHNIELSNSNEWGTNAGEGSLTRNIELESYGQVEVWFWQLTPYYIGTPTYSIDGGATRHELADVEAIGQSLHKGFIKNMNGTTEVKLYPPTAPGNSGRALFSAVWATNAAAIWGGSIEWTNWAWPGLTSTQVKDHTAHYSLRLNSARKPRLLHLGLGGNDMVAGTSLATMKQNYRDIVANVRDNYYFTSDEVLPLITTTMPYCDINYPDLAQWDAVYDAVAEVTAELGGMCIDMRKVFPPQSQSPSGLFTPQPDYHLSFAGHQLHARIVRQAIGRRWF